MYIYMLGIITEVYKTQQRPAQKTENNTRGELEPQRSDRCNGGEKTTQKQEKEKEKEN